MYMHEECVCMCRNFLTSKCRSVSVSCRCRPNNQKCVSLSSHETKKLQGYIHRWTRDALKVSYQNIEIFRFLFHFELEMQLQYTCTCSLLAHDHPLSSLAHSYPMITHTPLVSSNLPINLGDGQQLHVYTLYIQDCAE